MSAGTVPPVRDRALLDALPVAWAHRHAALPLGHGAHGIDVAVADTTALGVMDDLAFLYGAPVRPVAVAADALGTAIRTAYAGSGDRAAAAAEAIDGDLDELRHELATRPDLLDAADDAPIIRLVNALLREAVEDGASDLHVEPTEERVRIRVRIDGLLRDALEVPGRHLPAIVSRIKILARLDVAERRLPQDGRVGIRVGGRPIDVRVSIVPTAFGERAALRLLDRTRSIETFADLGFDPDTARRLERLLQLPHGIVLVTGPTGSGKTTTLYAALRRLATGERNVLTIEDPVEYELAGVGQMQVNPRVGLDFATGLRAILRQDPDVILVGEIRDRETVRIALQAALTGHLVFATLHTNDAPSSMTRLLEMGVEPYLIASTVRAVLAQRLVRRRCAECTGVGCVACHGVGLRGRIVVYELLESCAELREQVLARTDAARLRAAALERGMTSLERRAEVLVEQGVTSPAERARVLAEDA